MRRYTSKQQLDTNDTVLRHAPIHNIKAAQVEEVTLIAKLNDNKMVSGGDSCSSLELQINLSLAIRGSILLKEKFT